MKRDAAVGRRIVVVGSTGSGKTTLARALARRLGLPNIELDALYWGPNWTETPTEAFRERVRRALEGDEWIVDGNYSKVRDIVWGRAVTLVWLDYPLWVVLWRLLGRTLRRTLLREELWSGNREHFHEQFFSRDSLFLWALRTYKGRREEYPLLFAQAEYRHLQVVRLRSRGETADWVQRVTAGAGG